MCAKTKKEIENCLAVILSFRNRAPLFANGARKSAHSSRNIRGKKKFAIDDYSCAQFARICRAIPVRVRGYRANNDSMRMFMFTGRVITCRTQSAPNGTLWFTSISVNVYDVANCAAQNANCLDREFLVSCPAWCSARIGYNRINSRAFKRPPL